MCNKFRTIVLITGLCVLLKFPVVAQVSNEASSDTAVFPYWISMMQDPGADFHATQRAFNIYWQNRTPSRGDGWKVFKRWEYINEPRVQKNGKLPAPGYVMEQYRTYRQNHQPLSMNGNWTRVGPVSLPANSTSQPNGLGRINAIAFHPSDANTFFIGSPSGGFWKTSDGGATWNILSASMPTLGVSSILVHPTTPSTIWIGTGDRDASDAPGMGVYKSTDGGLTWSVSNTGMGNLTVGMMVIHPNPAYYNIMLATTSGGIYKSTNGGSTWTRKSSNTGSYKDIKFNPGDPAIVYATEGGRFYRSTDTGDSWTQITSGIIAGTRMVIGVSPGNASYVYLAQTNGVFAGLLRSTDNGLTFTTQCTTPNIMDYACDGSGTSNQSWYDLCMAVDQTNANILYVGGINIWKSVNGGTSFTINSHWVGSSWGYTCAASVHADIHCLTWSQVTGKLFTGCDGGIYSTANGGTNWADNSSGLAISQVYKIGQSATNEAIVINGYQDNGTATNNGTAFTTVIGGDGMECIIDYSNPNYRYGALYYGDIRRSTGGGYSTIAANGINGITESGAWVTPYILHETDPNTMFAGYVNVWRCNNVKASSGITWTAISSGESNKCTVLEQSPANVDVLYVVRSGQLKRSDNANAATPSWTSCTLPGGSTPTDLEAHPTNPNIVYATAGNSVYKSVDKGISWTNISGTLPATPVNCIVYDKTSTDGIYIGTQTGIFYQDPTTSGWVAFNNGLPVIDVRELEIYYDAGCARSKIKAATYGGGLWSGDLYEAVASPSNFTANPAGISEIDLTWNKNPNNDNILLVFNTSCAFGTPSDGTSYNAGSSVPGGGTVIYSGSAYAFNHLSLTSNTIYYYKIWSCNSSVQYSHSGTTANASTFCTLISSFPWYEGFENGGLIPTCWSQSFDSYSLNWAFQSGGYTGGSHPSAPHSGSRNGCLYYPSTTARATKLISPVLNLTGLVTPVLRFWHTQEIWNSRQDELRIYYRTTPLGAWQLLATYQSNIASWTQECILLPSPSATYYIAFEGTAKYGYGVCIDDVAVTDNTMTWNGTGIWSAYANWTPPFLPATFDKVVISSGVCTVNSNVSCKAISIQPAGSLLVAPSVTVTVDGDVVIFN